MSEGAGAVILEELEHALKRNAHIYAELLGFAATSDAFSHGKKSLMMQKES
ncbi:hypothetical protein DMNBHIDG_02512 [Candidatus Methanoperedenaceae archaeon GB37]|nr:hypothetical protein DMNBHIDG_02512 [Candidatus Methanoperedenaceae archaeon GB37]